MPIVGEAESLLHNSNVLWFASRKTTLRKEVARAYQNWCVRVLRLSICTLLLAASNITSSAASMTFRFAEPDTADGATPGWIVADGEIAPESAKDFRDFVMGSGQRGSRSVVLLNSPGGSLLGGIALGESIRKFGLGTRVGRSIPDPPHSGGYVTETEAPGTCFSACAFAFLGGKWRVAADRSIGVHQHYREEDLKEPLAKKFSAGDLSMQQLLSGLLADYVVRMGVDARFLTRAASAGPYDMYRFSTAEMASFGITWNDLDYSDWVLEAYKDGLIAVSRSRNEENVATLFCRKDRVLRLLLSVPNRSNMTSVADIADPLCQRC